MNRFVGMFVWCLLLAVPAFAQQGPAVAVGQIESIGINNFYRPGDWVPMRVRIDSQSLDPGTYTVRIEQRDLDGQKVFWTRAVPITGGGQERFEVYFMPDPLDGGLSSNPAELRRQLRVTLADDDGREVGLLQLPTPPRSSEAIFNSARDIRLVIAVSPKPVPTGDYGDRGLRGISEDVAFLAARPADLPQSVLGYDMADAVLWGDYSVDELDPVQKRALDEFVARGGHLVIMQRPAEPQTVLQWGALLPVNLTGTTQVDLPGLLSPGDTRGWAVEPTVRNQETREAIDKVWPRIRGTATLGTATPKDGAIVETRWEGMPFVVRKTYGTGAVTWLGIDVVANPTLSPISRGWAGIWSNVFGWNDDPTFIDDLNPDDDTRQAFQSAGPRDFGTALLDGMKQSGKSAALVGIAILFFVGYWLVAGPGVYLYLATKKRASLSWFAFGAAALAATVLTLGIVSLVLRGDPQVAHQTLLRGGFDPRLGTNDGMAVAYSNVGLYIPSDGDQTIALEGFDETNLSTVTPYIGHPRHYEQSRSSSGSYEINVRTAGEVGVGAEDIPFRSTLKKLETVWRGNLGPASSENALPRIEGAPKLAATGTRISGKLLNVTGQNLESVWIAYRQPMSGGAWWDQLLFIPTWENGTEIDLAVAARGTENNPTRNIVANNARPFANQQVIGRLDAPGFWPLKMPFLRGINIAGGGQVDELDAGALVMLSFFDRFPVVRNEQNNSRSRIDPRRLNARHYDVSNALLSGSLVVVGMAEDAPMPVPLTVNEDEATGDGTVVYQFVLPLERETPTASDTTADTAPQAEVDDLPRE
ncbi:MAG: hypothetical protein AAGD32_11325 [Planctomycetota bacterium]